MSHLDGQGNETKPNTIGHHRDDSRHDYPDESNLPPYKRARRTDTEQDRMNPNPSKVVHVRQLNEAATEADLLEALTHFGLVAYATCMPNKRMALVEFEEIEGAQACVSYSKSNDIFVAGTPAAFNYSTSPFIQRLGLECAEHRHVVMITISNVQYPINVDVVHQVCQAYGEVRRIAMIRRHGTQALVEFDSVESALKCKRAINGADIYSNCCTIKVEFAKPEMVKVTRHDQDQWDYTVPPESGLTQEAKDNYARKTLLAESAPDPAYNDPSYRNAGHGGPPGGYGVHGGPGGPGGPPYGGPGGGGGGYGGGGGGYPSTAHDRYGHGGGGGPPPRGNMPTTARDRAMGAPYGGGGGGGGYDSRGPPAQHGGGHERRPGFGENTVLMIYGIDHETINCDKVFNLLCLYGNVQRVKFMKTKRDTVMVEMARPDELQSAIANLHNARLFRSELAFRPSHQDGLYAKGDPFEMPDGTLSYKDFNDDWRARHQRFDTPESARRNRITKPTPSLHWYNAPPDSTDESIKQMFTDARAPVPHTVVVFPAKSERSASGVAEFSSPDEATDALVLANHHSVETPASRNPYVVKLAYAMERQGHRQ